MEASLYGDMVKAIDAGRFVCNMVVYLQAQKKAPVKLIYEGRNFKHTAVWVIRCYGAG